MSAIIANTIGSQYDFQPTDGKNLSECPEGMEWVRISEKKIGKGKGKTVAAISVPSVEFEYVLFTDAFATARKEYLTELQRAGKITLSAEDVSEQAVFNWYAGQAFSGESISNWFDQEMGVYLTMNICTVKGWNEQALDKAQETYVNTKLTAYKAAFMECAAKFPKLAEEQKKELLRVIDLNDLSGSIVDRIKDKISVKVQAMEEALGF